MTRKHICPILLVTFSIVEPHTDAVNAALNRVLCFTVNWVNDLNLMHLDASVKLGNVVCETLDNAVPSKFHQTDEGVYINLEYFQCERRQNSLRYQLFNCIFSYFLITFSLLRIFS